MNSKPFFRRASLSSTLTFFILLGLSCTDCIRLLVINADLLDVAVTATLTMIGFFAIYFFTKGLVAYLCFNGKLSRKNVFIYAFSVSAALHFFMLVSAFPEMHWRNLFVIILSLIYFALLLCACAVVWFFVQEKYARSL